MRLSASLPLVAIAFYALAFSTQSQSAAQTVAATPPMERCFNSLQTMMLVCRLNSFDRREYEQVR